MKQYFTYDDPPQCNPTGISPEERFEPLESSAESCDNRESFSWQSFRKSNKKLNRSKLLTLPEWTKPLQLKYKTKRSQEKDDHIGITTLSSYAFNRGKQSVAHSMPKETSTNDHGLPNCVFNGVDQSISPSKEEQRSP